MTFRSEAPSICCGMGIILDGLLVMGLIALLSCFLVVRASYLVVVRGVQFICQGAMSAVTS